MSFPPVLPKEAKILILGSYPSVRSREVGFYYGHPHNRFWKVLAAVCESSVPETIEEKKAFLHRHNIALWDVLDSCTITGSSDSSIRDPIPNDIATVLQTHPVQAIFCNGATAGKLYSRMIDPDRQHPAEVLPSTSPANATWTLDRLIERWQVIRRYMEKGGLFE